MFSLRLQAVKGQPVVAVIHASAAFRSYMAAQNGGIFSGSCSRVPDDGDESVLVVGFTSTYWIVRTSFGPNSGKAGYAHLAMGENACGIDNWGSYPISYGKFLNCSSPSETIVQSHTCHMRTVRPRV